MRLLIVGGHDREIAAAIGMAVERGATLRHVVSPEAGLEELRAGRGAELILIEVGADIAGLIRALAAERIFVPVVAYGVRKEDERIDYDDLARLALEHRPRVIVLGASAYPRTIDFAAAM